MTRRRKHTALAAVLIVAVALVVGTAIMLSGAFRGVEEEGYEGELPAAFGRHLEKLAEAVPELDNREGPAGAAVENWFQRAYPNDDITVEQLEGARAAATTVKGRDFPRGKGRKGTWVSVGPSNAVYPFFGLRDINLYVPNEYAAGGRTTSLAIAPTCKPGDCPLYIGAAGGGVWRTKNALTGQPNWDYLSGPFQSNSIGSITIDPNDSSGRTVYVGTGEFNACGSGCVAGVGIYKSTDGGDTWTGPLGNAVFKGRGIGSIAVKPGSPNVLYAGSGRALLGASSVCCGGAITIAIPGAAIWGLYKSTDGGASWTLVHNGAATTAGCTDPATVAANGTPCSPRGVRRVVIDPADPNVVYAASYARGVWRSPDNGATWTQIKTSLNAADVSMRPEISVNVLPNGKTRMYVGEGATGPSASSTPPLPLYSRLFRSDDVRTGAPVFTDLTSNDIANPGYGSYNYCTGQCWYDNTVYSPPGHPDVVYLGGSYQYRGSSVNHEAGALSNGRAVLLSTDAGVSFTDMTADATDAVHPNASHPDEHALVTNPNNAFQYFQAGDGGIVRSSGEHANISANCASRGLDAPRLARCQQLLSRVPTKIESLNKGLSTLQFQSLSVSPFDAQLLQGGTQDNGTWQTEGSPVKWLNTMIGDGGQSGFDVGDPSIRVHTYAGQGGDVNFSNGAVADWNWMGDPLFNGEGSQFYVPLISDPKVSKTLFTGTEHVWRTKTLGQGSLSLADFRAHCNQWTGDFPTGVTCGDWAPLGNPGRAGRLTCTNVGTPGPPPNPAYFDPACSYGSDRAGGNVAATERATSDSSTLWAATTTGRVFVSKNANADPSSSVTFTRIDPLSANDPNRFPSSIYIDPADPNHAWISYSGFSTATPSTPGHVFEVAYNPGAGTATWTKIDDTSISAGGLGDIPVTDLVRDDASGDLYVATDFGVFTLASGTSTWTRAADGLPNVEVAGLTIVPDKRILYAATHGLSAWRLNLG